VVERLFFQLRRPFAGRGCRCHIFQPGSAINLHDQFTPGIGGSLCYPNIWSVDHAPNPIDVGGVQVGVSGGASWVPGRFRVSTSWGNRGGPAQLAAAMNNFSTADLDSSLAGELSSGTDPNWIA
jgi:hypothetical protein